MVLFAAANLVVGALAFCTRASPTPGAPGWDTTFEYTAALLTPRTWSLDSWWPMSRAYHYLSFEQPDPPAALYTQVFFTDHVKFIYPPSALLVWEALALSGVDESAWHRVLNLMSVLAVAVTALAAWRILEIGLAQRLAGTPGLFSWSDQAARAVVVMALVVTFFPVVLPVSLGQIQTWINALASLMIWSWLADRRGLAGVLAGIVTLIKPQTVLLLLWGLLRGERRFSLPFIGTLVGGLVVSTSIYGVRNHLDYLSVLSYVSSHGESYLSNQSVNGLLNRLLHNGSTLHFRAGAFAPYHPLVAAATMASSAVLVALALFWPARSGRRGDTVDFCIMLLTGIMASPTAWRHHYGVLIAIYAVLVPALLSQRRLGWTAWAVVSVSYLLTSSHAAFLYRPAVETARLWFVPWNLAVSYLFAGALLVLGTLYASQSAAQETRNGSGPAPHR